MAIWGDGELDSLLVKIPMAHNGFIVDTNILVSATYDSDKFHDEACFDPAISNRFRPLRTAQRVEKQRAATSEIFSPFST